MTLNPAEDEALEKISDALGKKKSRKEQLREEQAKLPKGDGGFKFLSLIWVAAGFVLFYAAFSYLEESKVGAASILAGFATICFLSSFSNTYKEQLSNKKQGD